jgi:phage/plasmid-like protein (TIGR03299 family)
MEGLNNNRFPVPASLAIPPRTFSIEDVSACEDVNGVLSALNVGDYSKESIANVCQGFSLIKDDRGEPLTIVSDTYNLLQPVEAFAFLDCMKDEVGFDYAKAGFTHQGRQLFIQGKIGEFEVPSHSDRKKGDVLEQRIVARTSFDGSLATSIQVELLRVWCDNGCASWQNEERIAKVKHTRNQRRIMASALQQVTGVRQVIQNLESDIGLLSTREVTPLEFEQINQMVFSGETRQAETAREAVASQFTNERLGAFGETAWDVLNAFTAYQNHDRTARKTKQTTKEENRFRSQADSAFPVKVRNAIEAVLEV